MIFKRLHVKNIFKYRFIFTTGIIIIEFVLFIFATKDSVILIKMSLTSPDFGVSACEHGSRFTQFNEVCMQQTCSKHEANMQQTCSKHAANMHQTCSKHAVNMQSSTNQGPKMHQTHTMQTFGIWPWVIPQRGSLTFKTVHYYPNKHSKFPEWICHSQISTE